MKFNSVAVLACALLSVHAAPSSVLKRNPQNAVLAASGSESATVTSAALATSAAVTECPAATTVFVTVGAQGAVESVSASSSAAAAAITTAPAVVSTSIGVVTTTVLEPVTLTVTVTKNNQAQVTTKTTTKKNVKVFTTTHRTTAAPTKATPQSNGGKKNNQGPVRGNGGKNNGGKNNGGKNNGGKKNGGGKVVTVTQTVKHVKPTTRTITYTKKNGGLATTTVATTIISTQILTVTAAPTPTTIIQTTTLDRPVTVTATVTENGQEVTKLTEVLTQTVTVTSDVVQQTLVSVTTQSGSDAVATDIASTSAVDSAILTTTASDALSTTATDSAAFTATASDALSTTASDVSATTTSDAPAATSSNAPGSGDSSDPQTSLKLDEANIMTALFSDGNPTNGQAATLKSRNNFMNFCETQNVPITNGLQTKTGSCNPVPMGRILAVDKMPSSIFTFPPNFGTIASNSSFTIKMKIGNMVTGNFVAAATNYYGAPAQVDGSGTLIGHSHVTIELIDSFESTTALNPNTFAFFKGLNGVADGGILTADVTGGLPPGKYRMASINSAANHQPALVAVAQHGTLDAFSYFNVV